MSDFSVPSGQKSELPFAPQQKPPAAAITVQPSNPTVVQAPDPQIGVSLAQEQVSDTPTTPEVETDKDRIEKASKYTQDELDDFWTATLNNQPYIITGEIGKPPRTIGYSFKTRGTDEVNEMAALMEDMNIAMKDRWNNIQSGLALASSLHSYNGKVLATEPLRDPKSNVIIKTALQQRYDFLSTLPQVITQGLSVRLWWFDIKLAAMQREVFSENFF